MLSLRPALPRNIPHGSEMDGPDVMDLPAVRFRCRPRSYPRSRQVAKALNEGKSSSSHKTFAGCVQYYRSAVGPLANMQALETDPLQRHSKIPGRCALNSRPKLRANQEITCVAFPTQPKVISDNNELSHDGECPEAGVSFLRKGRRAPLRNTSARLDGQN
jgi:hypothetical protein